MKHLKNEKGVTGVDITIAIILITIFVAIITTLFFNIRKTSSDIERRTQATAYAVSIIEQIKANGFDALPTVSDGTNIITGYEDKYIQDNGVDTPYYQTIRVEDYSEIAESTGEEEIQPDVVKKITVTIAYKSGNENQEISLSTSMSKDT